MSHVIAHSLESSTRTKDVIIDGNVTFESLMLNENVLRGLKDSGFRKPSPIQFKSIPVGRCGFDIIVKSKSGTGKTLVYSIVALETIEVKKLETQVLILAPTREIAVQIKEVIVGVGSHFQGLKVESFIGGLPLEEDREKCKNCHVAVGAPGRVKHLIKEGILKPKSVRLLVLDEVDKLMESSFVNDINEIFNSLPDRKQIVTTSATYPEELATFLDKYMLSPTYIEAEIDTPLLLGLRQFVRVINPYASAIQEIKFKNEELLDLFSAISFTQCLIFTNYQTRAESISNFLNQKGWRSMYISAAQSQPQRLEVVKNLKNFQCKILLSTDLTARGIDAAKVDLVINYDIPASAVTYLHRMGRAGRYGSSGVCIDFVSSGATLRKWQCMLGAIGGCSLGVPKLPNGSSSVSDLLQLNVPSEHCIFGIIDDTYTPDVNITIKNNVLDLKREKNRENASKGNSEDPERTYKEMEDQAINRDVEELDKIPSVGDRINGRNNTESTRPQCNGFRRSIDVPTSCRSMTDTKREGTKNVSSNSREAEGKNMFYKNKALLCVMQSLSHISSDEIEQDLNALRCYLDAIKKDDENEIREIMSFTKSKSVAELSRNIDDINHLRGMGSEEENSIENIFEIAYRYSTQSNSRDWRSFLPSSELSDFQNLCLKESEVEMNYSDEADAIEDGYETDNEMVNTFPDTMVDPCGGDVSQDDGGPEIMKWVPVEESDSVGKDGEHHESTNWDHLSSYFHQCSESLWLTGLCFESPAAFDDWFYHKWQPQVFGVRDYIQQNIYVQELSRYQKSRFNQNT